MRYIFIVETDKLTLYSVLCMPNHELFYHVMICQQNILFGNKIL